MDIFETNIISGHFPLIFEENPEYWDSVQTSKTLK